jgi:hypothetical protein
LGQGTALRKQAIIDNNQNILFDVSNLANNKKYIARLVRRKGVYDSRPELDVPDEELSFTTTSARFTKEGQYDYEILPAKVIKLKSKKYDTQKELFKFHFGTSKYNNLNEKVSAMTFSGPKYRLPNLQVMDFKLENGIENFDEFDVLGYTTKPSSASSQVITNKGLVQSNIYYNFEEEIGGANINFNFLGNDNILEVHAYKYDLALQFKNYIKGLSYLYFRNVKNLSHDIKTNITISEFNTMLDQNYYGAIEAFDLPLGNGTGNINVSSGITNMSNSSYQPPKRFIITIEHAAHYFWDDLNNKWVMSAIMNNTAFNTHLKNNNPTLYSLVNYYINSEPNGGQLLNCQSGKFGMIYKYPFKDKFNVGTKKVFEYKTLGSCTSID